VSELAALKYSFPPLRAVDLPSVPMLQPLLPLSLIHSSDPTLLFEHPSAQAHVELPVHALRIFNRVPDIGVRSHHELAAIGKSLSVVSNLFLVERAELLPLGEGRLV